MELNSSKARTIMWASLMGDFEVLISNFLATKGWSYKVFASIMREHQTTLLFHIAVGKGKKREQHYDIAVQLILDTAKIFWLYPSSKLKEKVNSKFFPYTKNGFYTYSCGMMFKNGPLDHDETQENEPTKEKQREEGSSSNGDDVENDPEFFEFLTRPSDAKLSSELVELKKQMGGFYLVYTLFFKQPSLGSNYIRLALSDQETLIKLEKQVEKLLPFKLVQIYKFMLLRLKLNNAFDFVLFPEKYNIEYGNRIYLNSKYDEHVELLKLDKEIQDNLCHSPLLESLKKKTIDYTMAKNELFSPDNMDPTQIGNHFTHVVIPETPEETQNEGRNEETVDESSELFHPSSVLLSVDEFINALDLTINKTAEKDPLSNPQNIGTSNSEPEKNKEKMEECEQNPNPAKKIKIEKNSEDGEKDELFLKTLEKIKIEKTGEEPGPSASRLKLKKLPKRPKSTKRLKKDIKTESSDFQLTLRSIKKESEGDIDKNTKKKKAIKMKRRKKDKRYKFDKNSISEDVKPDVSELNKLIAAGENNGQNSEICSALQVYDMAILDPNDVGGEPTFRPAILLEPVPEDGQQNCYNGYYVDEGIVDFPDFRDFLPPPPVGNGDFMGSLLESSDELVKGMAGVSLELKEMGERGIFTRVSLLGNVTVERILSREAGRRKTRLETKETKVPVGLKYDREIFGSLKVRCAEPSRRKERSRAAQNLWAHYIPENYDFKSSPQDGAPSTSSQNNFNHPQEAKIELKRGG